MFINNTIKIISNIWDWVKNNTDPISLLVSILALVLSVRAYLKTNKISLIKERMETIKEVSSLSESYLGVGHGYAQVFGGDCVDDKIFNKTDRMLDNVYIYFGKISKTGLVFLISMGNKCRAVDRYFSEYSYLLHLNDLDIKYELMGVERNDASCEERVNLFNKYELKAIELNDYQFGLESYNLNYIFSQLNLHNRRLNRYKKILLGYMNFKAKL